MFELKIWHGKKLYWQQSFESLALLNGWLAEERKRPYWKKVYTTEIIDNSAAYLQREKAMKDALDAALKKQKAFKKDLKEFLKIENATVSDCQKAIAKVIQYFEIDAE